MQRGLAVTLLTGRVVEPHEVMTPGSPGPLLLIVDCPTEAHLATISAKGNGPLCQWTVRIIFIQTHACLVSYCPVLVYNISWRVFLSSYLNDIIACAYRYPSTVLQLICYVILSSQNSTSSDVHCVMAHMGPYDLVTSPAYQAWIQSLGSIWTHMYISSGNAQPTTLRRATELQVRRKGKYLSQV